MGREKFDESDFQSFHLKCNDSLDSLLEASDLARNILSETSLRCNLRPRRKPF